MKLGRVAKPDKRNKAIKKKKLMMTSCQKIVGLCFFFLDFANLKESENRIPDA